MIVPVLLENHCEFLRAMVWMRPVLANAPLHVKIIVVGTSDIDLDQDQWALDLTEELYIGYRKES